MSRADDKLVELGDAHGATEFETAAGHRLILDRTSGCEADRCHSESDGQNEQ